MTLKDQFIMVTIQKCISGTVSYYITELYPIMSQHKMYNVQINVKPNTKVSNNVLFILLISL